MLSVSEIKQILRQEHLSISKYRGQNFLVDQGVQKKIIQAAKIKPSDQILEIGPGLGALTEELAQQAAGVVAIEKDKALARILKQTLVEHGNLQIIHQDILKYDLSKLKQKKIKVVSNLPFYISTPIIGYLLEEYRQSIKEIFITVQQEVGKRLAAKPKCKDYSSLSIFVQYFCQGKILFSLPKRAFYPQPKVDSVFVHLRILDQPSVQVKNQQQFFQIVRAAFSQRRKTILNSLAHKLAGVEKGKIQQWLTASGLDPGARPEQLSLNDFAAISNTFYKKREKGDCPIFCRHLP